MSAATMNGITLLRVEEIDVGELESTTKLHEITMKHHYKKVTGYSSAHMLMNIISLQQQQCKMAAIDELLFRRQNLRRVLACWRYISTFLFVQTIGQGLNVKSSPRYRRSVSYGASCCQTNGFSMARSREIGALL